MLICEMAFVFHKSKQALTRATLKKLLKTIKNLEISFCLNEQFCFLLIKQKCRLVNDNGHESANL